MGWNESYTCQPNTNYLLSVLFGCLVSTHLIKGCVKVKEFWHDYEMIWVRVDPCITIPLLWHKYEHDQPTWITTPNKSRIRDGSNSKSLSQTTFVFYLNLQVRWGFVKRFLVQTSFSDSISSFSWVIGN